MHGRRFIDLTGKRFGRWTVLAILRDRGAVRWLCRCDCGTSRIVHGKLLRKGKSKSCGCLKRELSRKRATTHGMSGTKEYTA